MVLRAVPQKKHYKPFSTKTKRLGLQQVSQCYCGFTPSCTESNLVEFLISKGEKKE